MTNDYEGRTAMEFVKLRLETIARRMRPGCPRSVSRQEARKAVTEMEENTGLVFDRQSDPGFGSACSMWFEDERSRPSISTA
jgi:hypothetical protein